MFNFKWTKGRQDSGYLKFTLLSLPRLDCYILKYPRGSEIKPHLDTVEGFNHHRLNITLNSKFDGGLFYKFFYKEDYKAYNYGRFNKFRPDIEEHGVSRVTKGTRYVLSIGWLTK